MTAELEAGIVAATAMMYLRVLVVCAIFNLALARTLALPLLALGGSRQRSSRRCDRVRRSARCAPARSPIRCSSRRRFVFALLFVVVSMLATFAQSHLGRAGIFELAGIVGVTDIDPFVLSLAQGGAAGVDTATAASAILIATSSNNVLKAVYAMIFSRRRGIVPAIMLTSLAVLGLVAAFFALTSQTSVHHASMCVRI